MALLDSSWLLIKDHPKAEEQQHQYLKSTESEVTHSCSFIIDFPWGYFFLLLRSRGFYESYDLPTFIHLNTHLLLDVDSLSISLYDRIF
jgi:hypothetical protein